MIELIKQISDLGWSYVLICFFLVICIIVTFISGYRKALSALGLRSTRSIHQEEVDNKIANMQSQIDDINIKMKQYQSSIISKQEEYHEQSIHIRNNLDAKQNELKDDIHGVKSLIEEFMDTQNQTTVAMLRSSLWRLHKDFVTQGYVTPDGLKTFMEMGKVYEKAGGDDIYHEKLQPEVEALDIHYPNGSIYNPETDS